MITTTRTAMLFVAGGIFGAQASDSAGSGLLSASANWGVGEQSQVRLRLAGLNRRRRLAEAPMFKNDDDAIAHCKRLQTKQRKLKEGSRDKFPHFDFLAGIGFKIKDAIVAPIKWDTQDGEYDILSKGIGLVQECTNGVRAKYVIKYFPHATAEWSKEKEINNDLGISVNDSRFDDKYLVMKYLGKSLADIMEESKQDFDPRTIFNMLHDVIPFIEDLHDKHKDNYGDFQRMNVTYDVSDKKWHIIDFAPTPQSRCQCFKDTVQGSKARECEYFNKFLYKSILRLSICTDQQTSFLDCWWTESELEWDGLPKWIPATGELFKLLKKSGRTVFDRVKVLKRTIKLARNAAYGDSKNVFVDYFQMAVNEERKRMAAMKDVRVLKDLE